MKSSSAGVENTYLDKSEKNQIWCNLIIYWPW